MGIYNRTTVRRVSVVTTSKTKHEKMSPDYGLGTIIIFKDTIITIILNMQNMINPLTLEKYY